MLAMRSVEGNFEVGFPYGAGRFNKISPHQFHQMAKKILLAEDDSDIRFILNLVLNNAGYNVEPLAAGDTLVEGKHEWPDLFILDKACPGSMVLPFANISR